MASAKLSWLWQSVVSRLVSNILWIPLAAMGSLMVAYLKLHESIYAGAVIYGIGAFALILASGGFIKWLHTMGSTRNRITPTNAYAAIRDCLDKFQVPVQKHSLPNELFGLIVNVNGRKIAIIQRPEDPHLLHFRAALTFDDAARQTLQKTFGSYPEAAVVRDVRMLLAAVKIGYSGLAVPLQEVTVTKTALITPTFSEYEFLQTLGEVESAFVLMTEAFFPPPNQAAIGAAADPINPTISPTDHT